MKRINQKAIKAAFVLFFFINITLGAQTFPVLDASPKAFEYAQRIVQNNNNWRNLAEASLWASSVNIGPKAEEMVAVYMDRLDTAVAELTGAEYLPLDLNERGEYVLAFLYKRFLKSYSEHQTRVDEIFVTGKYNCVSSSVLYIWCWDFLLGLM